MSKEVKDLLLVVEESLMRLRLAMRRESIDLRNWKHPLSSLVNSMWYDLERYYDQLADEPKAQSAEVAEETDPNITGSAAEPATCHFESDPKDGPCAHCGQYHF